jgi:hypothetical protein
MVTCYTHMRYQKFSIFIFLIVISIGGYQNYIPHISISGHLYSVSKLLQTSFYPYWTNPKSTFFLFYRRLMLFYISFSPMIGLSVIKKAANGIFIEPEHPAWQKLIRNASSDIYHTPGYLHACSIVEDGQLQIAMVTHNGRSLGLPLFIRNLPDEVNGFDAVSPYGYPMPVSDAVSVDEWKSLVMLLVSFLRDQGIVSLFIRTHPLLTSDAALQGFSSVGTLLFHGETVYQQINLGLEKIHTEIRSRFIPDINRLNREGWRFIHGDHSQLPSFINIYYDTMNRLNANSSYYFPVEYFDKLFETLPDKLSLFFVIDPNGATAAAALFFNADLLVQYHLGGTSSSYLPYSPAKLLFYKAMLWYQSRGFQWFHIGGGLGAKSDSLFQFKSGFSKKRAKFHTIQIIVDQQQYDALSERYQSKLNERGEKAELNYFPAYRAPVLSLL